MMKIDWTVVILRNLTFRIKMTMIRVRDFINKIGYTVISRCHAPKSMMNCEKPLVWSNRPELIQLGDGGNVCYI